MSRRDQLIDEYFSQKREKLIDCPFQPGNLRISEKACFNRHKAAKRKKMEIFRAQDLFNYFVSQGLLLCEKCSVIKNLVS
jgi:hypothetical protein